MARQCTICDHKDRAEMDLALARGANIAKLAQKFAVSYDALYRHKQHGHVVQGIAEARAKETPVVTPQDKKPVAPDDLVGQMRALQGQTLRILVEARDSGDGRLALSAIKQAADNVELMAKLEGELIERVQSDVRKVTIMKVVRPGDEAREVEEAVRVEQ